MNKREVIRHFVLSNNHLPKQGTQEWKNARKYFIGGSEVATVLKKNKNKTVRKLILEKMGFHVFSGNAATFWGNVFEPLIRNFTNHYFQCSIVETGSIPYYDTNLSYSPDGIAHVKKEYLEHIVDTSQLPNDRDHIVLFEFKCPHSRIPNGDIPEHYVPQPMTGMNIINICEVGIFIEAIYRRCAFYDLQYNNKHVAFGHYNRTKLTKNPIEYGFLTIYAPHVTEQIEMILDFLYESDTKKVKQVYDLGTLYDKDTFDKILELCVSGELQIDYTYNQIYNPQTFHAYSYIVDNYNKAIYYETTKKIEEQKKEYVCQTLIGILPYKLIEVHIHPVYKDHQYIDKHQLVDKSSSIVDFIKKHDTATEKEITTILKHMKL